MSILSDQHYQPRITLNNCHGHDIVIRDLCYWLFSNNPVAQQFPTQCLTPVGPQVPQTGAGVVGMSNISNKKVLGPIFPDLAPLAQTCDNLPSAGHECSDDSFEEAPKHSPATASAN